MKRTLATLALVFGAVFYSNAQVNDHAIGLRLGGYDGDNGIEISYQHGFSEKNRVELDLGLRGGKYFSSTTFTGVYHWDWNIIEGLNWYVGPGAAVNFWRWKDNSNNKDSGVNIAIGGQIGLEYDFQDLGAPILVSLDTRPMYDINGYGGSGFGWGYALGVRYIW